MHRAALARILDIYEQVKADNKKAFAEPEIKEAFFKKFPALYAELVSQSLAVSIENREDIRGEWIKYAKGNDAEAEKLFESMQGKGTGWCVEGKTTAHNYINQGDFYVYYTHDKHDSPTQPRLAIQMSGNKIGQIRGILPHQEAEPIMQEVLDEKLNTFGPEADAYRKKSEDMKRLTALERKHENKELLTKEDLVFLYEINTPIEGFGYEKDPRVAELRAERNWEEDSTTLCDCDPKYIARSFSDITESTQVFCAVKGDKITLFDYRLPGNSEKLGAHIEFARRKKDSGSIAELDLVLEEGVAPVTIDRRKTMEELLKEGEYDQISDDFLTVFPDVEKGPSDLQVFLVQFGKTMKSEDIISELDKIHLRPLTAAELLALGATFPELQRKQYLAGLGSKAHVRGDLKVPSLGEYGAVREAVLLRWGDGWRDHCRFPAVRT